jgi:F-type H+-transporting ATPase subunit epsilon
MADPLTVELVAADRTVWSGEADMVIARTYDGEIGVLPGHAPVLGVLVPGPVQIRQADEKKVVAAVHGGFLSIADNAVAILAEQVELAEDIDVERARQALERATGRSGGGGSDDGDGDEDDTAAARARAEARIRASELAS